MASGGRTRRSSHNATPAACDRPRMRLFELHRHRDPSGVSGVGVVAQGVEFDDGTCVVRWLSKPGLNPTTVVHYDIASVRALHGHDGATTIEWVQVR